MIDKKKVTITKTFVAHLSRYYALRITLLLRITPK